MGFQLAVSGQLPEQSGAMAAVRAQIANIRACLAGEAGDDIQALVSPSYTGPAWLSVLREEGTPLFCFSKRDDPDWSNDCQACLWEDTSLRGVLGEIMCDRADLVLAVWNEDVTESSGAAWEIIQMAHRENTPCLWISSRTGQAYWSAESYYEPFDQKALDELCGAYRHVETEPLPDTEGRIPLLGLGDRLRRRFLKKFRALKPETAPEQDRLLQDGFSLEADGVGSERVRRRILRQYERFDRAAIGLNTQYQAIIYWRAILPLIATVFLAVGFYAETLMKAAGVPATTRTMIAGIGFLIHGLLNLYVFFLSRSRVIRGKHGAFLQNRYIAEALRVLIHLVPFGIYTDLRAMCGGDERTRAGVQAMTLGGEHGVLRMDGKAAHTVLVHIRELLTDQIAYHRDAAGRFRRILDRLGRWHKGIFAAGFVIVILRAFLQFYICFFSLEGTINGVALSDFVRSAANMIAMMVPAWASYFLSKISLCNYEFSCDSHERMEARLSQLGTQVDTLLRMGGDVPVDVLNTLAERLVQAMIVEDTLPWERKFKGTTVTQL